VCMEIPSHSIRRIFLPSMVRGESATPHPSYYSSIGGAWQIPHAPPVVFFSHRWCVVSLPRLTCRVILPSMVHGDPPTPHPSYFSLIDGAWRVCRAPPVVFFSHRWCVANPPRPTRRIFLSSLVRGESAAPLLS